MKYIKEPSYNFGYKQTEATILAKVVSVSDVIHTNGNKTEMVSATVEFENFENIIVQRAAFIYKKTLDKGIVIGNEYLCNVIITDERPTEPLIFVSNLVQAVKPKVNDFNINVAEVKTKTLSEEMTFVN